MPDYYPLPILSDLLQPLGDSKIVFSSIDLISGFWQSPLDAKSRETTAFSTPCGHYEWLSHLPFRGWSIPSFPVSSVKVFFVTSMISSLSPKTYTNTRYTLTLATHSLTLQPTDNTHFHSEYSLSLTILTFTHYTHFHSQRSLTLKE